MIKKIVYYELNRLVGKELSFAGATRDINLALALAKEKGLEIHTHETKIEIDEPDISEELEKEELIYNSFVTE